jgi:translation initiation factor 2 subunit 2
VEVPVKVVDHEKRYIQLLKRVTELLNKNNPELGTPSITIAEKSKIVLKPPQSTRVGSKKTAIINFAELCKQLDRHPEHVMNFFINELGREGSMGNQGFST